MSSVQGVTHPRMSADQRREQLLDVTRAIAARHGFHALSIERVAREAGITRPVVYGHFGDLAGLVEALLARETRLALTQLAEVLPGGADPSDPARSLLPAFEAYLDAAEAEPDRWRLVLMPPDGAPAALREAVTQGRETVIAALTSALAPSLRTPDPELSVRLLSTLSDESVRLHLTDPDGYPRERLVALAKWLLDGLARMHP